MWSSAVVLRRPGFRKIACLAAMLVGFLLPESAPAQESSTSGFQPQIMEVIVAESPVKDGETELSKVSSGNRLWVFKLDESKEWAYVKIPDSEQKGWISRSHLGDRRILESARPELAQLRNLEKKGYALKNKGQFVEARPLLLEALAIRERLDPGSSELAFLLRGIGQTLLNDDPVQGRSYLERYVNVLRELQGKTGENFQIAVTTYVDALTTTGELDESIAMLEGLLGVNADGFDDASLEMLDIRTKLMSLYREAEGNFAKRKGGRLYAKAALFLRKAIARSTVLKGRTHPVTASSLNSLGLVLTYLSEVKESEQILNEALEILNTSDVNSETSHLKVRSAVLNNLALIYEQTSRLDKACEALRSSLKLEREISKNDARYLTTVLTNLARVLGKTGANSEAETVLLEALELSKQHFGVEHLETAKSLVSIGDHCFRTGQFGSSLTHYTECLHTREKLMGTNHVSTIESLLFVARTQRYLGNLKQAEVLAREALVRSASTGQESQTVDKLARLEILEVLAKRDDHENGIPFGVETLELCERQLGKESPAVTRASSLLGVLFIRSGRHSEADRLLRQELAISRHRHETEPSPHSLQSLFASLNNLGLNVVASGHPDEALPLMSEARQLIRKFERSSWSDSSKVSHLLNDGLITFAAGNESAAWRLIQESRVSERSYTAQVLPGMPQDSVDDYLATAFLPNLARCLSLAYHRPTDELLMTLSAGWLINGKAIGQEALAEGALINTPETTPKVRELRDVRSRLSQLASFVQSDPDWRKEQVEQIAELESQERTLTADISRHGLGLGKENPWVSVGQLREQLPYDAVLVNIARIRINNFAISHDKYSWSDDRYIAWIISSVSSTQPIHVVDLGAADTIDSAVAAGRKQLNASIDLIKAQGELTAEKNLKESLAALSGMLLEPLQPHLKEAKEIIISPDSELWLLPWEILKTVNDGYLVEEYRIRYVLSGRELVNRPAIRSVVTKPLIFADPDFDYVPPNSSNSAALSSEVQLNNSSGSSRGRFLRLPGTAQEAATVRPALEAYTGQTVDLITRADASEARFKQLSRPRVLVLSSHGFFLSDQSEPGSADNPSAASTANAGPSNPLLRCGMALAGCNQRASAASVDDGILTGLEIVGTDLRGTELVVLSACETGVGDVRNGEGVAGLRQAFQLAGAESVISSLWQIPDQETARLMNDLFKNLAAGMNKSEALRQAQLMRIKARRERFGAAHPFFWAAFTLTGNSTEQDPA